MTPSPAEKKGRGISPNWSNLPRRRCANCGKNYKPTRPLRPDQKHGFCSKKCKDQFHKNGGAYQKLKDEILKRLDKEIDALKDQLQNLVHEELRLARIVETPEGPYIMPGVDTNKIAQEIARDAARDRKARTS